MHHWLDWADWGAALILDGIVLDNDAELDRIVRRVHAAVVFFCYPHDSELPEYEALFNEAYGSLLEWAVYVEQKKLPTKHLTYTLHVFLCHIGE